MSDDAFMTNEPAPVEAPKFEEIVGEGKRYSDQDAAAKALVEKDRFIEQLKREAAEMRDAIKKRDNEQEFLDRLEQLSQARSPDTGNQPPKDGIETPTAMKPEDVLALVEQREAAKVRQDNLNKAVSKLQELYGDDYRRHVSKTARDIGMSTQDLTDLAARSPEAFFRTIGVGVQPAKQNDAFAPPRSTVTGNLDTKKDIKDYKYFANLRKELGEAKYYSIEVQNEKWKALKEMGEEAFYGRS